MDETKKTRGAWVIHVRESDVGQGADVGCSPAFGEDMPHLDKQKDTTDEKGE